MVSELINSDFDIKVIFAEKSWISENKTHPCEIREVSEKELNQISGLTTANKVLAVVSQKNNRPENYIFENKLNLILDRIQDPGNLGTIIRIADWFGISNIICSNGSVEHYNSKVIQATMGAIFRVNLFYVDLEQFLNKTIEENNQKLYGTLLEGESIYSKTLDKEGFIILGNESEGISDNLIPYIDEKISIPNYSALHQKTESLNIASAASVVCAEFRNDVSVRYRQRNFGNRSRLD